ncbi:MAG TPA: response regulator transcription factor [Thermoanaerobaculia bacterium]|nr:response regulator transcription factor [Thermoanaerobaculia bacterium]
MIRVAIVEDNQTIQQGLSMLIDGTPGYACVGAYTDCESLLAEIAEVRPGVLLMDIGLPGMSGIEGVRRVKAVMPEVNILILTVYDENDLVFEALCAGACGYLVKKTPPARLLEAIQEAHGGGSPMSSHIARKVVNLLRQTSGKKAPALPIGGLAAARRETPGDEAMLTARERDILNGLAEGNSYQALAKNLNISADTVRFHIRNIYRKLHVHSQSEAVAKALRKGII